MAVSYEDRISIATPEGVDVQLTLAGLGSRAVARILDQLIQTGVLLALTVLAAVAGGGEAGGVFVLVLFLVQFGYDVLFETLASGRTPGKRWSGLRVVGVDGGPVGFSSSAVRNLVRIVDFLPGLYAVGMVAVLASGRNQRLGDMAAGTLVVREHHGGRRGAAVRAASDAWSSPGDPATAAWDVSAVTADELATVRRFLDRRAGLAADARARLAADLAQRLRPKVVGPPPGDAPEAFLEAVAAAKSARL